MIDHLGIDVEQYSRSKDFYVRALEPLDYKLLREFGDKVGGGFGRDGAPFFWVRELPSPGIVHVAFAATDTDAVDGFHAAALEAGGEDNGAPGLRPQYHAGYYAAFVLDPDGNNIEAVTHISQ
ncbi:MAG: VOC family protein [Gaiellaceae bacterium]